MLPPCSLAESGLHPWMCGCRRVFCWWEIDDAFVKNPAEYHLTFQQKKELISKALCSWCEPTRKLHNRGKYKEDVVRLVTCSFSLPWELDLQCYWASEDVLMKFFHLLLSGIVSHSMIQNLCLEIIWNRRTGPPRLQTHKIYLYLPSTSLAQISFSLFQSLSWQIHLEQAKVEDCLDLFYNDNLKAYYSLGRAQSEKAGVSCVRWASFVELLVVFLDISCIVSDSLPQNGHHLQAFVQGEHTSFTKCFPFRNMKHENSPCPECIWFVKVVRRRVGEGNRMFSSLQKSYLPTLAKNAKRIFCGRSTTKSSSRFQVLAGLFCRWVEYSGRFCSKTKHTIKPHVFQIRNGFSFLCFDHNISSFDFLCHQEHPLLKHLFFCAEKRRIFAQYWRKLVSNFSHG